MRTLSNAPDIAVATTWDALVQALVGAALEVHAQLGPGYLEPVYQEALAAEFSLREVPHAREAYVPLFYKGKRLGCSFRTDFVCYGSIVVELKSVQALTSRDSVQLRSYLNATGHVRGLLFNFGQLRLQFKRLDRVRQDRWQMAKGKRG